MDFETLGLEVEAANAGLGVLKPPALRGRSGIDHRFSFIASDGLRVFAFDFYQEVRDVEVLRTYIKKYDTSASVQIVCLGKKPSDKALILAAEYGLGILEPEEMKGFFKHLVIEPRAP